jgi:hypothetical protein
LNSFSLSSLVATASSVGFAVFIFTRSQNDSQRKIFATATLFGGIWTSLPFLLSLTTDDNKALHLARLICMFAALVPPTFLHFMVLFLNPVMSRRHRALIVSAYAISALFLFSSFTPLFIRGTIRFAPYFVIVPGPLYLAFAACFILFGVIMVVNFFTAFLRATGHRRNQLKYVFIALFTAIGGGVLHICAVYARWEPFPHDLLVAVYPPLMTYAVIRHRLLDIHIVIKRTVLYTMTACVVTAAFELAVFLAATLFSGFADVHSEWVSIVAAVVIAFLFYPVKTQLEPFVDNLFHKRPYDYAKVLQSFGRQLTTLSEMNALYPCLANTILGTLGLRSMSVLELSRGGQYVTVASASPPCESVATNASHSTNANVTAAPILSAVSTSTPKAAPFVLDQDAATVKLLKFSRQIVLRRELAAAGKVLGATTLDAIQTETRPFIWEALVPVFVRDRLVLVLILGERESGDLLTAGDLDLLNTIVEQTSLVIGYAPPVLSQDRSARVEASRMNA